MNYTELLPYITAASLFLNVVYTWISFRRKEITALVKQTMVFYKDDTKTIEELWEVMDKLDAVMDKK